MIVAEDSKPVQKIIDTNSTGGLSPRLGSYYNEFVVINYLDEPLYAVDFRNKAVLIQQHPNTTIDHLRRVEIRSRSHVGPASTRTFNVRLIEDTPDPHHIMRIYYTDLREHPHFVEELNAVLCFGDHLASVKHPHSKEALLDTVQAIISAENQKIVTAPFILSANDPTGKITGTGRCLQCLR